MNTPQTLVMKFGGTSVGTPEAMAQSAAVVQKQSLLTPRLVVVTSALSGVTDLLLNGAVTAARGDERTYTQALQTLQEKHFSILDRLVIDPQKKSEVRASIDTLLGEFTSLCHAIHVLGEATPRALDAVASLGERMAVRLLAVALEAAGARSTDVESTRLIITDDRYQNAHPDLQATRSAVQTVLFPLLDQGLIPVVTGFIGATPAGVTTTLGRGGSDYTAALLGAVLPSDEVWIWTDVNGVMTADPRLVPSAATIEELTYRELSELAYAGAKVLHPKSIRPVIDAGVGLRVLNTFVPAHPGTRLVLDTQINDHDIVKSVTAIRGQTLVTLEGRGMLGIPGVAARTFSAIASTGTSITLISQASSEQSICFAIPASASGPVIRALELEFEREFHRKDIDRVWASPEVVIVTVVGEGMKSTPGIAGKVFSTLGDNRINVIAIAQGSSEVSISFVIKAEEVQSAVRALHDSVIQKVTL